VNILLTIHHPLDLDAGAPGTTMELARAYEAEGHAVRVMSYDDLPARVRGLAQEVAFPAFLAGWLRRQDGRHAIDVIDASTGDAWLWKAVTNGNGPVLVTRSHGLEHLAHAERVEEARATGTKLSWKYPLYRGGFRLWEVAASLRRADLTFFLNRYDRDYAVSRLRVPGERAHIVRNGVAAYFLNRGGRDLGRPVAGPLRIAMIGSYISRKGVRYGAAALAAVLSRHADVSAAFLGPGCPAERVLDDYPAELHDRIQVVPRYRRAELPSLLEGHHINLFPTLFEGFGKTLIEAMACGLAPVTTTVPGPTEFVSDGENGLLVPPRDAAALERALERLVADRALLGRLRLAAWETAQDFSWERIARTRLGLYRTALNGRSRC
jgi:glycosyltransferase involved in cell wall biosynthesis